MNFLRPIAGGPEFVLANEALGVRDVLAAGTSECLYVFVRGNSDDHHIRMVRDCARETWPSCQIVIAMRAPVADSAPGFAPWRPDGSASVKKAG
jgi:hypothetical protein